MKHLRAEWVGLSVALKHSRPESSLEAGYDSRLLDRLGRALTHIYDDTRSAALPERLRDLVERLERAEADRRGSSN